MWQGSIEPDPPAMCTVCGDALAGDMDDDPWHPGGPLCGDCVRARADDELMWALEAADEGDAR